MIRSVLALFLFAAALCALIIIDPGAGDQRTQPLLTSAPATVTRATAPSLLPEVPQAATVMPTLAVMQGPVRPAAPVIEAPRAEPAPAARVRTDESSILGTTSSVLAGLGLEIAPSGVQGEMATMTNDALAGIGAVTGRQSSTTDPDTALERLVIAALKEGQSDDAIHDMVNAAALAGELAVPKVLVTADGLVDTHVLLKAIVVQATIASGGDAPEVPEVPSGDGTGVEVRVVQRATQTEQYRFYTVARGDSLGAIAVKFYGNVSGYQTIFEANRSILSSPNEIQAGQRLAIPNLSDV